MKRIKIYPKGILIITGKNERYSRYLIEHFKKHLKKEDHLVVSISEFCNYMGLDEEKIEPILY